MSQKRLRLITVGISALRKKKARPRVAERSAGLHRITRRVVFKETMRATYKGASKSAQENRKTGTHRPKKIRSTEARTQRRGKHGGKQEQERNRNNQKSQPVPKGLGAATDFGHRGRRDGSRARR
jgi:hypothetical protein